jgi:hypothetical protein
MESRRILLVANQTAPGPHLKEIVSERIKEGPCTFVLLVPAAPPQSGWTWTDEEAFAMAEQQMQQALSGLKDLGAEIEGRVEAGSPLDAITALIAKEGYELHQGFDEIILSTLPPGVSRWLKQDLPHRIERHFEIPVTHVIGQRSETSVPQPGGRDR